MVNREKKQGRGILKLIFGLIIVLVGGVLFVGAVGGWFSNPKVVLEEEYYCVDECEEVFLDLDKLEYEDLIKEKKSFLVFVDQKGCTTADRLREYMEEYMKQKGIVAYKIMFSEAKESSLHDFVKYYPSVVIVSKGKVVGFLRADEDEDAEMYNDYDVFMEWIERYF